MCYYTHTHTHTPECTPLVEDSRGVIVGSVLKAKHHIRVLRVGEHILAGAHKGPFPSCLCRNRSRDGVEKISENTKEPDETQHKRRMFLV